ncbi:GntR family transcriptional regulator [Emcibacter sp.]|uniref:GntR family transcriptional regulator n=1 Tax=Emcibacter sp. TaxID=1979954 RepID=UPI002AA65B1B|nr:GntR family transcriptional regulator [Emcibacter sp.]
MKSTPRSPQQVQALQKLRELILSGEFAVGQRVSELAVVEKLDISRTPVRLALTILEHEGFLRTLPRGGFTVRQFTIRDVIDAIEIRGFLEGMAARRVAEKRLSREELEPLRQVTRTLDEIIRMDDRAVLVENYKELNGEFHQLLLELADSAMLDRSFGHVSSLPFSGPNAFAFTGGDSREHIELLRFGQYQHANLLEAIENGQGQRAEFLAREHAQLALKIFSRALKHMDRLERIPGASLLDLKRPGSEE